MITIRNLTKKFENVVVLDNISYNFESGKNYLITGESGCGKSTLLSIIAGYDEKYTGKVQRDNKANIQYVFQDILLYSNVLVKDNIRIKANSLNLSISDEEIKRTLEKFRLYNKEESKVCQLSQGEKQRLQLAMIFITNPDVLLMDEPTANLDYQNKVLVIETINENFSDTDKIIISHDSSELFRGYETVVMGNQKIESIVKQVG
ncbi:ATP-binding cassette domain-containing protein [Butyrivibrio sp. NC3005]|uniref:ATP-binding cassette domain-containing protein n=1 Tax=Butyrivibrio sp. NC3005 TaxID=1280685 RepID=UPI00041B967D|nr:ABC transporter ATP-binding protein [Butyrivibrio sp. NC3005]